MAEAGRRALIGVTGPRRGAVGPRLCVQIAVWLAGGRALQLKPGRPLPDAQLDGVVITGGHDIEPVLYKAVSEVEGKYDRERDQFEARIIDKALDGGVPMLGICRGAQLLNVRRGGTLHQDVTKKRRKTSNRRTLLPLKTLNIVAGSMLQKLFGKPQVRINSLHKQSIDRLGDGLKVAGCDKDNIVQAVEDPAHNFLLGVQWHPEFLLYLRPQRRLFHALVAAAVVARGTR